MDDSSTSDVGNSDKFDHRIPLGMGSFGQQEREQFGQNIRLAMECIEGTAEPVQGKAIPMDEPSIRQRLKALSQEITSHHADLLELLVRFDDLEQERLGDTKGSMRQRRADAAMLMAGASLQSAGRDIATADRYQVIVSVDASALSAVDQANSADTAGSDNTTPSKRPHIKGAGPIAHETARRLACDCSLTLNTTANGEPVDIGRKSRIWPSAMARAIRERDQHCVWPGCTQTHHLHIHHIEHWADGGATSIQNAACLCSAHHSLVHEGGYAIQRVEGNDQRLHEQFVQQQHAADISQFDVEKGLRNDKESFNTVRALSPENYRFRVVDAHGQDIRSDSETGISNGGTRSAFGSDDYTRVYCGEPVSGYCHAGIKDRYAPLFTSEAPAYYTINTQWVAHTLCH